MYTSYLLKLFYVIFKIIKIVLILPYLVRSNTQFPCVSDCGSKLISLEPSKYLLYIS